MLEIVDVTGGYGDANVLDHVSLEVAGREAVALFGPNGAGKSTLMAAATATLPRRQGTLRLAGRDLSRAASHTLVAAGISLVPEGRQIFAPFTVWDNLRLGTVGLSGRGTLSEQSDYVFDLFPRLAERNRQRAGTLSGGEQQMVAVGRALMARPKLILMDEPSMGLAPALVEKIYEIIRQIKALGTSMLIIEQNATMALSVSNRAYVLQNGQIVLQGSGRELLQSEAIRKAYLGGKH